MTRTHPNPSLLRIFVLVTLAFVLAPESSQAKPEFGQVLNDFCTLNDRIPPQPYDPAAFPSNCMMCHLPGFFDGDPAHHVQPDATEYQNGNYGFFCPDSAVNNTPPVLNPIGARMVVEGQRLTFSVSGSDADGDALAFSTVNLPAGATFTDNGDGTASFDWTPAIGEAGVYTTTFVVSDDFVPAASAMEDVTVAVLNANRAPVLDPIGNQSVDEGQTLAFTVSANDLDGDALSLSASNLPTGAVFVDNGNGTADFNWTPGFGQAGNYPVSFTVQDSGSPVASDSEEIVIAVGDVNRPPVLTPIGNQTVAEGQTLTFAVNATDPDGDNLTLQVANLPAGADFSDDANGTGSFSWTPGFGEAGNYSITVTAMDDGGPSASDSETLTIAVGDVNRPPVLAPIGNRAANEGELLAFVVTATDPDGDTLALQAADPPTGSSFVDNSDGTGAFSWTPAFGQTGNFSMSFTVIDNGDPAQSDSEQITISVGNVNRAPVLAPIGNRSVSENELLTIAVSASDPDGDGLTLQVANPPNGALFTDNLDGTGTLAWTPAFGQDGNHAVTFTATDDGDPAAADSEQITITVGDVNQPPLLAPIGNQTVNEGELLSFVVTASDPDGDSVALSAANLPAGASFTDNGNGNGSFEWTPDFGQAGNHVVTFTASDAGNPAASVSKDVNLSVGDVNRPPVLAPVGNRSVNPGETLSFTVTGSDPDGDALSFAAAGLPAGTTFLDNQNGTADFSWTPDVTQVGSTSVTWSVTDTGNPALTASETGTITVNAGAGSGGEDLVFGAAIWWKAWGGSLNGGGNGAPPGSTVQILDAESDALLGTATANEVGFFALGICWKPGTWPQPPGGQRDELLCSVPERAPCMVKARVGETVSPAIAVWNAPEECGPTSEILLRTTATYDVDSTQQSGNRFLVEGDHAPIGGTVDIRDADTDVTVASQLADAYGRFDWSLMDPETIPCRVRAVTESGFSDVAEVRKITVRPGQTDLEEDLCPPPASTLPDPAPLGAGGTASDPPTGDDPGDGGTPDDPGDGGDGGGDPGDDGNPGDGGGDELAAQLDAFTQTVYPLTSQYCVACHAGFGPGSPSISHADPQTAYYAVVDGQKVDLSSPIDSRLVQRLSADSHFCWNDCDDDAEEMRAAIAQWATLVGAGGDTPDPPDTIASASVTLADGEEGRGSARADANVIALWEFKEGSGEIAHDTSGVAPAIDLELVGTEWLAGGGLENVSGMAIGSVEASRKLYDRIADTATGSQEYTVEAWIIPGNTDQRGPARIVSYSEGPYVRNFTMGQDKQRYVYRNRSKASGISNNGTPGLYTSAHEPVLETALQHVVMTFDQEAGRRIYVNGVFTGDEDPKGPGSLDCWSPEFAFLLGNETTNNRLWQGQIHFVAVHDAALLPEQVQANFLAGIGQSYLLSFDVSDWVGVPGSSLELEVSEFDAFSYVLSNPTLVSPNPTGITIRNIRIAVNDQIPVAGQAFRNIDTVVNTSPQLLSPLASIITKDLGPEQDVFSLVFEVLGDNEAVVTENDAPVVPGGFVEEVRPEIGIRDFTQINDTMSTLTGVDPGTENVREAFDELRQQLPGGNDVRTFVSAHQVGIFKLALEYCDAMVESEPLREAFFGADFAFDAPATSAFADPARKQEIADRLVEGIFGMSLADQPGTEEASPVVIELIDTLTAGCNESNCDAERTRSVVKAACGAVLGSAPVMLH